MVILNSGDRTDYALLAIGISFKLKCIFSMVNIIVIFDSERQSDFTVECGLLEIATPGTHSLESSNPIVTSPTTSVTSSDTTKSRPTHDEATHMTVIDGSTNGRM